MLTKLDALLLALLSIASFSWPLLLASPLLFLIRGVRKRVVFQLAALAVVGCCYLILLIPVSMIMSARGLRGIFFGNRQFEISRDEVLAGIRFPKGSTITNDLNGYPYSIILSEDIEINGIPAGKGTIVKFNNEGRTLTSITTGRLWIYRGLPVPSGSVIIEGKNGISRIVLSQTTEIRGALFPAKTSVYVDTFVFQMTGGSQSQFFISTRTDIIVDGIPCRGRRGITTSRDEREMDCFLARPFDLDGYQLPAGTLIGVNEERQGRVVTGMLEETCVLSGVTWPRGVKVHRLFGAATADMGFGYEVPARVEVRIDDMQIEGPSTVEFEGDKLGSVFGHYVWHEQHYKSYKVDADGQIQREAE